MINMNIPMVTLAALMALVPLISSAEHGSGPCTIGRVDGPRPVPIDGDPLVIEGTRKADVIDCHGSPDPHKIYGNGGNDILIGSKFIDFIAGGGGNDTIYGGDGDDMIDGGAKDDLIFGGGGHDLIFGGVGSSSASGVECELQTAAAGSSYFTKGGSGDDIIYGDGPNYPDDLDYTDDVGKEYPDDDGNDCINAGSGEDVVYGQGGDDTILGGNHADDLNGGSGHDHIFGGWHTDTCTGGGGDDDDQTDCEIIK